MFTPNDTFLKERLRGIFPTFIEFYFQRDGYRDIINVNVHNTLTRRVFRMEFTRASLEHKHELTDFIVEQVNLKFFTPWHARKYQHMQGSL